MLLFAVAFAANAAFAATSPDDKTDLGESGNRLVAERFAAYQAAHPGGTCRAQGGGHRVILSGFGLFSGVSYNISGAAVRSMADPGFWPSSIRLDEPAPRHRRTPSSSGLTPSDHGGAGVNRELEIDGVRYDVCFLTLDVVWDLAGAILIFESSHFRPEAVIMTGRGGGSASFEAGALNSATRLSGFDSDGSALEDNRPRSDRLLEDYPAAHALPMGWDAGSLAQTNRADIAALGYGTVAQTSARWDNDYLCNNVAFLMAHAASNRPSSLAGGKLFLDSPRFDETPVVGFLHLPAVDAEHPDLTAYGEGVFGWDRVLARTIRQAIAR